MRAFVPCDYRLSPVRFCDGGLTLRSTGRAGTCLLVRDYRCGAPVTFNVRLHVATYRTAREFVEAVVTRYRSLTTYSDVGVIRPMWAKQPLQCWFESMYASPDKFRFQFIRPHPRRRVARSTATSDYRLTKYIAGLDGPSAYFYTQERGHEPVIESESGLDMAIAGATGISLGAAHTIGTLLFESLGGLPLTSLKRLRFRSNRACAGVLCRRVSGLHPFSGHQFTACFGLEDLLLRKLVDQRWRTEEVRFNIQVDLPIEEARFHVPVRAA